MSGKRKTFDNLDRDDEYLVDLTLNSINVTDTTASTNCGTGAAIILGGLGSAGGINTAGIIATSDTTASTSTITGSLRAASCYPALSVNAGGIIKSHTDIITYGGLSAEKQIRAGLLLYSNTYQAATRVTTSISLAGSTFITGAAGSGFTTTGDAYLSYETHGTNRLHDLGWAHVTVSWTSIGSTTGVIKIVPGTAGTAFATTTYGSGLTLDSVVGITTPANSVLQVYVATTTGNIGFHYIDRTTGVRADLTHTAFAGTGTVRLNGTFLKKYST